MSHISLPQLIHSSSFKSRQEALNHLGFEPHEAATRPAVVSRENLARLTVNTSKIGGPLVNWGVEYQNWDDMGQRVENSDRDSIGSNKNDLGFRGTQHFPAGPMDLNQVFSKNRLCFTSESRRYCSLLASGFV